MRTLRAHEREALLDLLDGWRLPDGWRGRVFFRRYLEDDPQYTDDNVWVAEDRGALVSCVQIFPRRLRSTAGEVPCGGIGSVFTARSHRGQGLASRLLGEAAASMRARGMEVSVLVAGRIRWYEGLGWRTWGPPLYHLRRGQPRRGGDEPSAGPVSSSLPTLGAESATAIEVSELGPSDDAGLEQVRALAERGGARIVGCAVRGREDWKASLLLAGNPAEWFRVARAEGGTVVAFVRGCVLDGRRQVTEWGYATGAEAVLAGLLAAEVPSHGALALPPVPDPALFDELARRGLVMAAARGAAWMLRCLDRDAIARRLGVDPRSAAELDDDALLDRLFPRDRFGFWTADRF